MKSQSRFFLELIKVLGIVGICLLSVLVVRGYIYAQLSYTPLPFAEPILYHLLTIGVVGAVGGFLGAFLPGRRGLVYSLLGAFLGYLGWAIVQQNLIVNPDIWKLWERGWLTVAVASGLFGMICAILIRLAHAPIRPGFARGGNG